MAVKTNITINIVEPGSNVPVPDTGLFTHGIGGTETTIIVSAVLVTVLVILSIVLTTYMYRKHKKQGRNTKLVHLVDSTKAVVKSKKRITMGLSIIALLVSVCTFTAFMLNTNKSNTNAIEGNDTEQQTGNTEQAENTNNLTVNAESKELTIEVKDQPVFAVLPVQVTVEEATQAGYTLTAYTDNTDLVSTTNPNNKIPMVTVEGDELTSLQDNTWGLALDNEPTSKDNKVYKALSTDQDNPTLITDKYYEETEANDTTTIYYGFYITPDIPYGTYTGGEVEYEAEENKVATVTFDGNGLYFNNNPEQTTNNVEYITGITSNTAKYSHTPNINDEGEIINDSYPNRMYPTHSKNTFVYDFPGASKVNIEIVRTGSDSCGVYETDDAFFSFWPGSHSDYTAEANYGTGVKTFGNTTGKYVFGLYATGGSLFTEVEGDSVTMAYNVGDGGSSRGCSSGYGYYAILTGYDADGNIVYLPGNAQASGEYQDPTWDLPFVFLGWNENKDATTATYESREQIELNFPLTKGSVTKFYAIWQYATKITFDGNGSTSGEMQDKIVPAGASTYVSSGNYSREGYSFTGWNAKPDGTGTSYSPYQSFTVASDKSEVITLYAQWSPATTIIYDSNGGEGNGPTQTIRAGNTSSIYGNWGYFNKDGYVFSHWNTEPDGSGETYYEGDQFTAPDQSTTITLYAQWSPATTIIYDGNGGSGNGPTQTIRAGETSNIYDNQGYFNKDGYVFSHWNTEPDGSGETYHERDQFTASDQSTIITLYAQWTPGTIIIYDGNGGEGDQRQQNIRAGETSSIYGNQGYFNKNGYIFSHWNTKPDGSGETYHAGDQFTAPDQSTTITLYAQWINGTILDTGATVGAKLKRLAGNSSAGWYTEDTNVTTIARASTLPADFVPTNDNTISIDGSVTPVYAWYDADTTTIYYYAESDEIIMNPDSGYMFYTFRNLSDATSIADWDTTYVTNMTIMFYNAGSNATTFSLDLSSWDTSNVTNMGQMLQSAGENATTWSIGDLSSWDTSKVTNMGGMFGGAGRNATTWSIGDLSSWDTSNVTDMGSMFPNAGRNATTWSIGDLSSWDTSKVTSMHQMFRYAGQNATTWSVGDLSSWDTSKVTDMSYMFNGAGYNATTWSVGDLSSWDTSNVTDMNWMFYQAGYNATTFSLDLSSWNTSKVTNMYGMFYYAGQNATTWSVTIPPKTGDIENTTSAFYGQNSSIYADPPYDKFFTLAAQTNPNTANTTGTPNRYNSSGNRSVYTTESAEDTEDTENVDDTSLDATSTPSRQEPLGEYQSSTTTSTKDTNIIIPILIVAAIALGTSVLGFLIYKSLRREDE